MGEIADMMINGDMDFFTGEYIGNGGGFPRTRYYKRNRHMDKTRELRGLIKFLNTRRPHITDWQTTINRYYREAFGANALNSELAATEIQKDFKSFVLWVNKTFPNK